VANETEQANFISVGNDISAFLAPALQNATIGMNLVRIQQCGPDSNVIKFRKSGSLVAETLSESTSYSYSASSELTDTSITCTAVKAVNVTKLTAEALRFGTSAANIPRIGAEQGAALARLFDSTLFALFEGFDQTITASATLTTAKLFDAQYTVFAGKVPPGQLVAVLDYKGVNEVKKDMTATTASAWGNSTLLDLLGGPPQANNRVGQIAGIDIYQTSGLAVSSSDDVGSVFHPDLAFCCAIGGPAETNVSPFKISEGFWFEIGSHMFFDIKEYHDAAGCRLLSDT